MEYIKFFHCKNFYKFWKTSTVAPRKKTFLQPQTFLKKMYVAGTTKEFPAILEGQSCVEEHWLVKHNSIVPFILIRSGRKVNHTNYQEFMQVFLEILEGKELIRSLPKKKNQNFIKCLMPETWCLSATLNPDPDHHGNVPINHCCWQESYDVHNPLLWHAGFLWMPGGKGLWRFMVHIHVTSACIPLLKVSHQNSAL